MAEKRDDEEQVSRRGFLRLGFLRAARTASDAMSVVGETMAKAARAATDDSTEAETSPRGGSGIQCYPPGGQDIAHFEQHCTKCDDCVSACPAWAIRKDESGSGFPVIAPNETACAVCEDPLPCIAACPTPALKPTAREAIRLGLAVVDLASCVVPEGQTCDFCVTYCPVAETAICLEADGPVILDPGCTGCGMCAVMCPESAIRIDSVAATA